MFGRCTFEKIPCNPTQVLCKSLPPDCVDGEVPSVDVDAACWTGQCAPAEACDWAPDCSYCAEDELICVTKLQKGVFSVCEPKPVDCGDAADIDCGCWQQICDASPPHTVCHDAIDDIRLRVPELLKDRVRWISPRGRDVTPGPRDRQRRGGGGGEADGAGFAGEFAGSAGRRG